MALGHAQQATGEILTSKSGLPELALLLSASSSVGPVTPPRSEPLHCHPERLARVTVPSVLVISTISTYEFWQSLQSRHMKPFYHAKKICDLEISAKRDYWLIVLTAIQYPPGFCVM